MVALRSRRGHLWNMPPTRNAEPGKVAGRDTTRGNQSSLGPVDQTVPKLPRLQEWIVEDDLKWHCQVEGDKIGCSTNRKTPPFRTKTFYTGEAYPLAGLESQAMAPFEGDRMAAYTE